MTCCGSSNPWSPRSSQAHVHQQVAERCIWLQKTRPRRRGQNTDSASRRSRGRGNPRKLRGDGDIAIGGGKRWVSFHPSRGKRARVGKTCLPPDFRHPFDAPPRISSGPTLEMWDASFSVRYGLSIFASREPMAGSGGICGLDSSPSGARERSSLLRPSYQHRHY